MKEGSLEAPTRHPIDWKSESFYDEKACVDEMERIFDICHGCRRCVSLCGSFPTLFDLIDEGESGELDSVDAADYWKVVDQCYLCVEKTASRTGYSRTSGRQLSLRRRSQVKSRGIGTRSKDGSQFRVWQSAHFRPCTSSDPLHQALQISPR